MVDNKLDEIITDLLTYSCSQDAVVKKIFYRALVRIAVCDIESYLSCILAGIKNINLDKNYSANCLTTLSLFIEKKYDEIAMHLPSVIGVILKCLEPANSNVRKTCMEKAVDSLQKLVISLPMVAYNQEKQKFAIGTIESIILIYDLKSATKSKELRGHEASVSAIEFNYNGTILASYCYQDFSIRI